MRYAKKLALRMDEDHSGAPYFSQRKLKEAVNETVREVHCYMAKAATSLGSNTAPDRPGRLQASADVSSWRVSAAQLASLQPEEARELCRRETVVRRLDAGLLSLLDSDLERLLQQVRAHESHLARMIVEVCLMAKDAGLLMDEGKVERLAEAIPAAHDMTAFFRHLLDFQIESGALELTGRVERMALKQAELVQAADAHTQYVDINVAGFRKLLKRRDKQVPHSLHGRASPCLEFHCLVTPTTRRELSIIRQLGLVLADAVTRLRASSLSPESLARLEKVGLLVPRGLGAESEMVLQIQRRMKDPEHRAAVLFGAGGELFHPLDTSPLLNPHMVPKPQIPEARGARRRPHGHRR